MFKRVLYLALALCLVGGSLVYADFGDRATLGGQNTSNEYDFRVSSDGYLITSSTAAVQPKYELYTDIGTNTLITSETGKVLVDACGGSAPAPKTVRGGNKHILPRAAAGMEFTVVSGARCVITLDTVDTNDTIAWSAAGVGLDPGDSLATTGDAGDYIRVMSPIANSWVVTGFRGNLRDNGTN